MNTDLPDNLREYLIIIEKELGERANNFWNVTQPILNRQSSANSNENGFAHVSKVELNVWRLLKESGKISEFTPYELFILSCAACSHDFDKGLYKKLPDGLEHGEASGGFYWRSTKNCKAATPKWWLYSKLSEFMICLPKNFTRS